MHHSRLESIFLNWTNPSPLFRAVFLGVLVPALFYVADFPEFATQNNFYHLALYLIQGLIISNAVLAGYALAFLIFKGKRAGRSPPSTAFHFLVNALSLLVAIATWGYPQNYLELDEIELVDLWGYWIYACLISALLIWYFSNQNARENLLKAKMEIVESQYHILRNQMQPHFLFNAFNSLLELIVTDTRAAEEMVHGLSELYQQILGNSEKKTSPVEQELLIAERYLEIEKIRFGERLRYSIDICPETPGAFVPSLLIQTLVENSIKHGIAKCLENGEISIKIKKQNDDWYQLSLFNTGVTLINPIIYGHGLSNSRSRLSLLYGERHQFNLKTENGGTLVSFRFDGANHA